MINIILENSGRALETEGDYKIFEEAEAGNKNHKLLVPFLNTNTVKGRNNIKFNKYFNTVNSIKDFFN